MSQRVLGGQFCNLTVDEFVKDSSENGSGYIPLAWTTPSVFHNVCNNGDTSHELTAALQENGEMKVYKVDNNGNNGPDPGALVTTSSIKLYFPNKYADAAVRFTMHGMQSAQQTSAKMNFGIHIGDIQREDTGEENGQTGMAPLMVIMWDARTRNFMCIYPSADCTFSGRNTLYQGQNALLGDNGWLTILSPAVANFDDSVGTSYEIMVNICKNEDMYAMKFSAAVNGQPVFQMSSRVRIGPVQPLVPGGPTAFDQLRIFIAPAQWDSVGIENDFKALGVQLA